MQLSETHLRIVVPILKEILVPEGCLFFIRWLLVFAVFFNTSSCIGFSSLSSKSFLIFMDGLQSRKMCLLKPMQMLQVKCFIYRVISVLYFSNGCTTADGKCAAI